MFSLLYLHLEFFHSRVLYVTSRVLELFLETWGKDGVVLVSMVVGMMGWLRWELKRIGG